MILKSRLLRFAMIRTRCLSFDAKTSVKNLDSSSFLRVTHFALRDTKVCVRRLCSRRTDKSVKENPWRIKSAPRHEPLLRQRRYHVPSDYAGNRRRDAFNGAIHHGPCRPLRTQDRPAHGFCSPDVFIGKKWVGSFGRLSVCLLKREWIVSHEITATILHTCRERLILNISAACW